MFLINHKCRLTLGLLLSAVILTGCRGCRCYWWRCWLRPQLWRYFRGRHAPVLTGNTITSGAEAQLERVAAAAQTQQQLAAMD